MQDQPQLITWEADEIRAGTRKIPGFAGHVPAVRNTIGCSYGTASAEVLGNPNSDALKAYSSSILGNRNDGYTLKGHPDHPFSQDKFTITLNPPSKIIPGYGGHHPGWQHSNGSTVGKYATQKYSTFTQLTRRIPTSQRPRPQSPKSILDLPPPPRDAAAAAPGPLYAHGRFYIPGTTLYSPAMRERFGASFGSLTLAAFDQPVPRVPQPLAVPADGKTIPHLELAAGYGGTVPRTLPAFIPPPAGSTGSAAG
jgi:hypothetical protein